MGVDIVVEVGGVTTDIATSDAVSSSVIFGEVYM
jgi:hypothetical protein